jgi:hypothetical protein
MNSLRPSISERGNTTRPPQLYEELFEKDQGPVIYSQYLECLLALEDYRRAERVVREQIRRNPGQVRLEVDLGWVLTAPAMTGNPGGILTS